MPKILGSILIPEDEKEFLSGAGDFRRLPVRQIFRHYADAATDDEKPTTLYTNILAANTLAANGQFITAVYAGTLADNLNQKIVWLEWFGTVFEAIDTFAGDTAWRIEATAIRVSSSVVRVSVQNFFGAEFFSEYVEVGSLSLAGDQDLLLQAESPSALDSGDITARIAVCDWHAHI